LELVDERDAATVEIEFEKTVSSFQAQSFLSSGKLIAFAFAGKVKKDQ